MFVRAVRDAADLLGPSSIEDGVSLPMVERQIRANFIVECDPSWDFLEILRNASKKALNKGLVTLARDGKSFRPKERPGGGGGGINRFVGKNQLMIRCLCWTLLEDNTGVG